ncbi:MAG: oxidoreductase [Alphaproteobacteria bacterium]
MTQGPEASGNWTAADMPPLGGKVFLVTGATGGLGFETVKALAMKGARVLMACRNVRAGERACRIAQALAPETRVEVVPLDLADLDSVRACADAVLAEHTALDGLINNAGVMAVPYRQTKDGFEMQFGVNHLGHFALTGRLLPALLRAAAARVVTVSSLAHRRGRRHFDGPDRERPYDRWRAYADSKLANLLFAFELERRFRASGAGAMSLAAHPGYAATGLQRQDPHRAGPAWGTWIASLGNALLAQPAEQGALPLLRAATDPAARGGEYYGPGGRLELRGAPVPVRASARAHDEEAAERLWEVSERLTGVVYDFG